MKSRRLQQKDAKAAKSKIDRLSAYPLLASLRPSRTSVKRQQPNFWQRLPANQGLSSHGWSFQSIQKPIKLRLVRLGRSVASIRRNHC